MTYNAPMKIGPYHLPNQLILAPMAGVTDRTFRSLCIRMGAGMAVSEMVSSNKQLWHTRKTRLRLDHAGEQLPRSVQIAGTDPLQMADAAKFNVDQGAQIIDINMGCPAKKVCNVMAGSALMKDESLVGEILDAVVNAVDVPVTLKTRTGWDPENKNAVSIARIAESSGIQALAVHGRTRACAYKGEAEYETIKRVKAAVNIPVIANGDIDSPYKAAQVLKPTDIGCKDISHISRNFQRNCINAGVRVIRFHDLRHTFATQFVANGGSMHALSGVLGHTFEAMTARYAHFGLEHAKAAAQVVSFEIPVSLAVLSVVILVGTMNLGEIVRFQDGGIQNWLIWKAFPFSILHFKMVNCEQKVEELEDPDLSDSDPFDEGVGGDNYHTINEEPLTIETTERVFHVETDQLLTMEPDSLSLQPPSLDHVSNDGFNSDDSISNNTIDIDLSEFELEISQYNFDFSDLDDDSINSNKS